MSLPLLVHLTPDSSHFTHSPSLPTITSLSFSLPLSLKKKKLTTFTLQPFHETNVHFSISHITTNPTTFLFPQSNPTTPFSFPMAEPLADGASGTRRKAVGKRATAPAEADPVATLPAPCGACKFLRRKCISGCIFAPHFGSDQGAARFAAVHKVFGASNVSKLLLHIPVNRRHDAVVTISYEAQARLSDPVYGCVSTILALQQQVRYSFSSFLSSDEEIFCMFINSDCFLSYINILFTK